ncbi:MAG: 3-isopropylmalate dehydratase small subunit [Candidatus Bathyarchaeota archaeon]|jgi:3-isopropylmalate/(R)-2-methylmalate dehydratase small subunit|nr:3-isopropylmalate dehydratase small subunit [Candidatus Bathyarchaeota archaeon]
MNGRVLLYGKDHINTDEIIPARYLNTTDEKELANHAMEDIDTNFVDNVKPGDIIVAGNDFGCGSSREHAVLALRGAGIQAVIAKSFARIFFRNSINNGFLAIQADLADEVEEGDILEINVSSGTITNLTQNRKYSFNPLPEFLMEIINSGGLLKNLSQKKAS